MKKLFLFHIERFAVIKIHYFFLFHLLITVTSLLFKAPIFDNTIGIIIIIMAVFLKLFAPSYDILGDYATFIQTLPYNRKTLLISKVIFQLFILTLTVVFLIACEMLLGDLSFLHRIEGFNNNVILNVLAVTIFAIAFLLYALQLASILVMIFSKANKRFKVILSYFWLIIMIILCLAPFVLTSLIMSKNLNESAAILVLIGIVFITSGISLIVNYLIYLRLDIKGTTNQIDIRGY